MKDPGRAILLPYLGGESSAPAQVGRAGPAGCPQFLSALLRARPSPPRHSLQVIQRRAHCVSNPEPPPQAIKRPGSLGFSPAVATRTGSAAVPVLWNGWALVYCHLQPSTPPWCPRAVAGAGGHNLLVNHSRFPAPRPHPHLGKSTKSATGKAKGAASALHPRGPDPQNLPGWCRGSARPGCPPVPPNSPALVTLPLPPPQQSGRHGRVLQRSAERALPLNEV